MAFNLSERALIRAAFWRGCARTFRPIALFVVGWLLLVLFASSCARNPRIVTMSAGATCPAGYRWIYPDWSVGRPRAVCIRVDSSKAGAR